MQADSELNKSISILGCGWLGMSLAKRCIDLNFLVKGSTTQSDKLKILEATGINPYLLQLRNLAGNDVSNFLKTDVLVIAIPPSKMDLTDLQMVLEDARKMKLQKVILISSTGIYKETNSLIDEENEQAIDSHSKLHVIESLVLDFPELNPIILRMGGLMGYDRHPIRFAKSSAVLSNPNGRVNMIHRDDAVEIIIRLIHSQTKQGCFNCCTDEHPTKKEFYSRLAKAQNTPIPEFHDDGADSFKIISNKKIKTKLDFQFRNLYDI